MEYKEMDDPYSFLALHLISISSENEIKRILVDNDYLFRMVIKEVRGQDLCGPFTDCAVDAILENKERMELMHELDKLAKYLFTKLDLDYLRQKILAYVSELGILEL